MSPNQIEAIANAGAYIWSQILEFVSPPAIAGLIPSYISPIHEAGKYLFLAVQLFVILGLLVSIFTSRRRMFWTDYLGFSVGAMFMLAACLGIPSFAAALQISRFYHVTMFLLAPFGVLGAVIAVDAIGRGIASLPCISRNLPIARLSHAGTAMATVLLVSLLLFQTGFVYEVTRDAPSSISLSIGRRKAWTASMDAAYVLVEDVVSAQWLSGNAPSVFKVYAGSGNTYGVLTSYALIPRGQQSSTLSESIPILNQGDYLYLGSANTLYGRLDNEYGLSNTSQLAPLLNEMNMVYSNGQGQIYSFP